MGDSIWRVRNWLGLRLAPWLEESALAEELDATIRTRDFVADEHARFHALLVYLADPDNWLGDPLDQRATLLGHFTPYELARQALGLDDSEA